MIRGLMIARGDLAVELSFERSPNCRRVLWFGEACHVPVIWATRCSTPWRMPACPRGGSHGCRDVHARRVRDAQQGTVRRRSAQMLADIIGKMEAISTKASMYRRCIWRWDLSRRPVAQTAARPPSGPRIPEKLHPRHQVEQFSSMSLWRSW